MEALARRLRERPLSRIMLAANRTRAAVLHLAAIAHSPVPTLDCRWFDGVAVNVRNRTPFRLPPFDGISLLDLQDRADWHVPFPRRCRLHPFGFSPDGRYYAVGVVGTDALELRWLDCEARTVRWLPGQPLNYVAGVFALRDDGPAPRPAAAQWPRSPLVAWSGPEPWLACPLVPVPTPSVTGGGDEVASCDTSDGEQPRAQQRGPFTSGGARDAFWRACSSQIVVIDPRTGATDRVGSPGPFVAVDASPDGRHLLLRKLADPPRTAVTIDSWPRVTELWSFDGSRWVHECTLDTAARWNPCRPCTAVWIRRAGRGGDCLVERSPPFREGRDTTTAVSRSRLRQVAWTSGGTCMVQEHGRDRRTARWRVLDDGAPAGCLFEQPLHSSDVGPLWLDERAGVVATAGTKVLVRGVDASIERRVPFLDAIDLERQERTRLFMSPRDEHVEVVAPLDHDGRRFLVRAESPARRSHYRVLDLATGQASILEAAVVDDREDVYSRAPLHVCVRRAAAVDVSFTIRFPDIESGGPLPAMLWIYPRVDGLRSEPSCHRLSQRCRLDEAGPFALLEQGMAVIEPALEIAGDLTAIADTILDQLIAAVHRAVERLPPRIDRGRLAVGGHCFGAYAAAMLLTHTDLFAAGAGVSGMYNLASLPAGPLTRGRGFAGAPDLCARLSPLCHVQRLRAPLLLVHGADDVAPVDYAAQSRQMFTAIAASGGLARLVEVPHMAHQCEAADTMLVVSDEIAGWCGRFIGPQAFASLAV